MISMFFMVKKPHFVVFLIPFFLGLVAVQAVTQPPTEEVRKGYELLYSGDRLEAFRHFERQLGGRPDDLALRFGLLMALKERIEVDDSLQADFERRIDALIALADRRYARDTKDAEALFYLAQAYMLRATYRFDHDKGVWGAARDGAKSKSYSDQYVKAHPDHDDAYLALGLYNYFVDIAPSLLKVFRFLLFLPSGNRVEGLKQIERAARQGTLFSAEAQAVAADIYAHFEGRTAEAIAAGEALQRRYPRNDDMSLLLGELYAGPGVEDRTRAAAIYQQVIDRRSRDDSLEGSAGRFNAIIRLAGVRLDQWRLEEAVATLTAAIDTGVAKPDWALPQCLLIRGNYRALLNDPSAGDDARRVQADPKMAKFHQAAAGQLKWMATRPASEAAVYAALISGNRLTSEGRWEEARRAYEELRLRWPNDPQVRLRMAQLTFMSGDAERALPTFSALAASGKLVPDFVKASALLFIGRTHDLAGRRDEARKVYQRVIDNYEAQRAAEAARLGLLTPYKRPAGRTQ